MLTETSWFCCTGFELDGYRYLNDSTSPDGAQEFAVVKIDGGAGKPRQVESMNSISLTSRDQRADEVDCGFGGSWIRMSSRPPNNAWSEFHR
jgi:hypothetical protein